MTEAPRRRRNRGSSVSLSPEEKIKEDAARDFLKKFKTVMEADRRYSKYFKTNDKAETYKKIKVYCKKYILTGNKSERDLVMALHIILSTGSVLNDINLTKAFQQKAKRLTPLS